MEDAFWVAAFLVWIASVLMGFSQSFTYAEMAGMFPNKSGGASVYGAMAWLRYSKFVAPISVWCNWFAWSSSLALCCSINANYILNLIVPVQASQPIPAIRTWTALTIQIPGVCVLNFKIVFVIGFLLMVIMLAIQHNGILLTARVQKWLALLVHHSMKISCREF